MDRVFLPLQPILDKLPADLKGRVGTAVPADLEISLPLEPLLEQLQQGMVRIPFGQLRQAAAGVLTGGPEVDDVAVTLPLDMLIQRVGVDRLPRRRHQKQVTVPEDVVSPFALGNSPSNAQQPLRSPGSVTPHAPVEATPHLNRHSPVPLSVPPSRVETSFVRKGHDRAFAGNSPEARLAEPSMRSHGPPSGAPLSINPPTPAAPLPPTMAGVNGHAVSSVPASTAAAATATPSGTPPMPALAQAVPLREPLSGTVQFPVSAVCSTWPEPIRNELARLNLADAQLVIPASILEKGLRQARVEFPWRLIRAWIRPAVPTYSSPQDAIPLVLPLTVVAPAFFQQRRPVSAARRQVTIDPAIPELFNPKGGSPVSQSPDTVTGPASAAPAGNAITPTVSVPGPQPSSAPLAGPAAASDTNFYSALETADTTLTRAPSIPTGSAGGGGTTGWVRRSPSPQQIVMRAAALEGVAGALVALPDGLAVASQVPSHINSETLAAFLPQIYSKVSLCTQELRMGALNNLSFTVGHVPWKIFRVNNLFFAAFGHPGQPMPTAQLAALAAELDRKPKSL